MNIFFKWLLPFVIGFGLVGWGATYLIKGFLGPTEEAYQRVLIPPIFDDQTSGRAPAASGAMSFDDRNIYRSALEKYSTNSALTELMEILEANNPNLSKKLDFVRSSSLITTKQLLKYFFNSGITADEWKHIKPKIALDSESEIVQDTNNRAALTELASTLELGAMRDKQFADVVKFFAAIAAIAGTALVSSLMSALVKKLFGES